MAETKYPLTRLSMNQGASFYKVLVDLCWGGAVTFAMFFQAELTLSQPVDFQVSEVVPTDGSQLITQKPSSVKRKRRRSFGVPIATFWSSPAVPVNDASVKQMTEGGFNLIWGTEKELDIAAKYKRRMMISSDLLRPEVLDNPVELEKLDALIDRVKKHPAMYFYYIVDEPNAKTFPALGRLVAYLRAKDPKHPAYINLLSTFATYALGVKGELIPAYQEYLRQFVTIVKPDFLSYDHYHLETTGDGDQYFLNISLIRKIAIENDLPFINIVPASKWSLKTRVPNGNELRWLNYTSLAYGAQGLSYYVYYWKPAFDEFGIDHGQMVRPDGRTTAQYAAAKQLNPQFVAVATELMPFSSLGAYHIGGNYKWVKALPNGSPFRLDFGNGSPPQSGMILGYFGRSKPTHILVVNLDYKHQVKAKMVSSTRLEMFDPVRRVWRYNPSKVMTLPPGGGMLVRQKLAN